MVAFRNTDTSGRTSGLLIRCVLYSVLALGLIIFDKRYDQLGQIRRFLSVVAYPVQVAVASPFQGWDWLPRRPRQERPRASRRQRARQELRGEVVWTPTYLVPMYQRRAPNCGLRPSPP